MDIFTIIFCIAVGIYSLRVLFFLIGISKSLIQKRNTSGYEVQPFISVLVPARNEEDNIENCIKSISLNNYPTEKYEIIAINDRSEDTTLEILENLKNEISNLRIVNKTKSVNNQNLKGKPGAIEEGIGLARGEILMMTDADCTVNPNWIDETTRQFADPDVGICGGFTSIEGKTWFENIQAVEWIFLHTMGSAALSLKQVLGCHGNNLSIRKKVYDEIGGYSNITFSVTEDLALLKATIDAGYKAVYPLSYGSSAKTEPLSDLKSYLKQHHRWTVGGMGLGWRGALFVMTTLAQWVGIVAGIITGNYWAIPSILAVRVFGDFILAQPAIFELRKLRLIPWIFPAVLFLMLFEPVLPMLLLKKDISWKGQVFRNG